MKLKYCTVDKMSVCVQRKGGWEWDGEERLITYDWFSLPSAVGNTMRVIFALFILCIVYFMFIET